MQIPKTTVTLTGPDGTPYAAEFITREEAERIVAEQDPEHLAHMAWREAFPGYFDGEAVLDLRTGEVLPSAHYTDTPEVPGFEHLLLLHDCPADLKERLVDHSDEPSKDPEAPPIPIPASLAAGAVGPPEIRRRLDEIYGPRTQTAV